MKKSIAIIGGGPSALLMAAFLDVNKFKITIYEKNKTLGRKFLVAGKGGFNLTHSEPIAELIKRFTPPSFLEEVLLNFSNQDLRDWLKSIDIKTFIGSSKRVYPEKDIKPITVLNSILDVINKKGVNIKYEHTWNGWSNNNEHLFNTNTIVKADYTIFALGGSSWKVTGSDGSWTTLFKQKGIKVNPFEASNCAYQIEWPDQFIAKHAGIPLKNITATCLENTQRGEAVITQFGLEGNAIYALSPKIRLGLINQQKAILFLDLKPTLTLKQVHQKLIESSLKNTTDTLRTLLKLSNVQIGLLKTMITKEDFLNPKTLSYCIKNLELKIVGSATIDEAISTVGGIARDAINENFELKKLPNHYCIGEMLDYDAPTGGYLLQSCFSTGVFLAKYFNKNNT